MLVRWCFFAFECISLNWNIKYTGYRSTFFFSSFIHFFRLLSNCLNWKINCDIWSFFTCNHHIVRRHTRWIAPIRHQTMTRRTFVGVPTINNIMQRTGNKSWPDKNNGVQRILRLWKPVTEDGMKTRNNSPAAVKTTGMVKWLLQRLLCKEQGTDQPKTSWAKTKKNRMEYHMFWGLEPRISETGNKSSY